MADGDKLVMMTPPLFPLVVRSKQQEQEQRQQRLLLQQQFNRLQINKADQGYVRVMQHHAPAGDVLENELDALDACTRCQTCYTPPPPAGGDGGDGGSHDDCVQGVVCKFCMYHVCEACYRSDSVMQTETCPNCRVYATITFRPLTAKRRAWIFATRIAMMKCYCCERRMSLALYLEHRATCYPVKCRGTQCDFADTQPLVEEHELTCPHFYSTASATIITTTTTTSRAATREQC